MAVPNFVASSLVALPAGGLAPLGGAAAPPSAGAGAAAPSSRTLGYTCHIQEQKFWCWAAVTVGVHEFYSGTVLQQCTVACTVLGHGQCCGNPVPSGCNKPWYLDQALSSYAHFKAPVRSRWPYRNVTDEIQANRPLGVRVGWSGGGGHFLTAYGYDHDPTVAPPEEWLEIADPVHGAGPVPYDDFVTGAYQGSGTWTHTYETC